MGGIAAFRARWGSHGYRVLVRMAAGKLRNRFLLGISAFRTAVFPHAFCLLRSFFYDFPFAVRMCFLVQSYVASIAAESPVPCVIIFHF